jgi:uncharacterized small protein (DUF1192 family)
MSDENTQEPEITEVEQNNKTEKKFQASLNKLVAVVGGKQNLKIPNKTPKDQLGGLVDELFKEEREATLKETKDSLKNLLKQYAEMDKAFALKQKEIDNLKKQKKEEFVKAAETLFNKIENVGDVEKLYYDGLKQATSEPEKPTKKK